MARPKGSKSRKYDCLVCGNTNFGNLPNHLLFNHNLTKQEYVDFFIGRSFCLFCGVLTPWSEKYFRYRVFCSYSCRGKMYKDDFVVNKLVRWNDDEQRRRQAKVGRRTIQKARDVLHSKYTDPEWIAHKSAIAVRINRDKTNKFGTKLGKQTEYKGVVFRSTWEAKFAFQLDDLKIAWQYEPRVFSYENRHYTPDFYLPQFDLYIEIKPDFFVDEEVINKLNVVGNAILVTQSNWSKVLQSLRG
jgi:hypothetical protein